MSKVGIFMADGCEEVEALTPLDLLRRAGIEVTTISINGSKQVTSSHKVTLLTDAEKTEVNYDELDAVILPGGMPGTLNLKADETVQKVIKDFAQKGKLVSAICAAPSVLGEAGLLKGRKATCYPGFEDKLLEATWVKEEVVCDGNFITSRGMGTGIAFGLAIIAYLADQATADKIGAAVIYQQ